MFGLGLGEILIISIFALIFIGPKKLPELARSLGKGIREFQNASKELKEQITAGPEDEVHNSTESKDENSFT
jgi:sec-independent protein translocase protein TatA